jgi:hypothetical protein
MTAQDPAVGTIVAVLQTLAGLAGNIAASDVHATLSSRVLKDDVLKNHDLARAVRNAIYAIIREAARELTTRDEKEALEKIVSIDENSWQEAETTLWLPQTVEGLSTDRTIEMFSKSAEEFARFKALDLDDWRSIVGGLAAVSGVSIEGDMFSVQGVHRLSRKTFELVVSHLHETFPRALYEILKEDFAHDGKAYGGLLIKLVGNISARQVETLKAAYESLRVAEEILTALERTEGKVDKTVDNTEKLLEEFQSFRNETAPLLLAHLTPAQPPSRQIITDRRKALAGISPNAASHDLLSEATCAVLLNNELKATAWLVSDNGHLLTVGHMFVPENTTAEIHVQFLNESPRKANKLTSIYNSETGDDFALLQLVDIPPNRRHLPVALKQVVEGDCTLQGYGNTFYHQSSGVAQFVGMYHPQNFIGNRLYILRSPEAKRPSLDGAAVFNEKLGAVVAIKTENAPADIDEEQNCVLAMPLYRIAQRWNELYELEKSASISELPSPIRYGSPKEYLEHRIRESYRFFQSYEDASGGLSERGYTEGSGEFLKAKYREVIGYYLQIYFLLCRRLRITPKAEIVGISRNFSEFEYLGEPRALASTTTSEIYTSIPGSRIKVSVSQMFRIADLLTQPESVKARRFYHAITMVSKMRRSFNERKAFKIGSLGDLRTVIKKSEEHNDFWKPFIPNFKLPTAQPMCFIPYELSLTQYLQTLRSELGSIFDSALIETSGGITNSQINGRLRIYPPGIGVISLGLTLEFKKEIHVEVAAQIAHNIEELLFVDPVGLKRPYSVMMLDIIEQVINYLFINEGHSYSDRRWRPPSTIYSFADSKGLFPEEKTNELAYLMSLAPANSEDLQYLFNRIQRALRTSHWKTDRTLVVAGDGVALFFVDDLQKRGGKERRDKLSLWLSETYELISAAVYAQQAFAEEIDSIFNQQILDDTWLPSYEEKFTYLQSLLETMLQVMRAIASIGGENGHLRRQGTGVLMSFARDVWTYSNPVNRPALDKGLKYIDDWLRAAQSKAPDEKLAKLQNVLRSIKSINPLFVERAQNIHAADGTPEQEQIEELLLGQLSEIEEILKKSELVQPEESDHRRRIMQKLRKQLGLI